jgi:hypothetical protein
VIPYILPGFLPSALLFRVHQGVHAVLNGVAAGKPRRGITRYLRFGGFCVWYHFLLVEEMARRGAEHKTPAAQVWAQIPVLRRRFDYPVSPGLCARDIAWVRAKIASPDYTQAKMNDASLPIAAAGTQLIEAQHRLMVRNRLPDLALVL